MSNFGVVFANENEMSDFEPVPTSFLNKPTYKKKIK